MVRVFLLVFPLIFIGCSNTVYRTVEVKVPVRCNYEMPNKPTYYENNFESAKHMTQYYLQIEEGLKQCIGDYNAE